MKIKAAVLMAAHEKFEIRELELVENLLPGEVLVKVAATGLCHTDLSVRDEHIPVNFPVVLGHEGAGIVERVGAGVTEIKPGDRVVLSPSSCGKCEFCEAGHSSYCIHLLELNMPGGRADGSSIFRDENGKTVSGFFFGQSSFGTFSLTRENNVVKVPNDAPLEMLGPLGCGLQTGAGTVLNVLRPNAGESFAVFGCGPVGLAGLMAAKAAGCTTIVAVDVFENRLDLARELGATHVVNSKTQVPLEVINESILMGGVHYALDTTGRGDVINQAVGSLRTLGKCALVAVPAAAKLEIDYSVLTAGRSIEYVIEGDSVPDIFIPRLIDLYRNRMFPFEKLVRFYDLEDINRAVADSESGTTLKAIIRMPE